MNRENFDSDEEMYMYWWLKELQEHGFIKEIILQPKPFNLSNPLWAEYEKALKTKTNIVDEELMKGHIYTTDVKVIWHESALDKFTCLINSNVRKKESNSLKYIISQIDDSNEIYSFVEVKPLFDQNNMTRLAKLNQKWVFDKFGTFVNIVLPEKHFKKSFAPMKFVLEMVYKRDYTNAKKGIYKKAGDSKLKYIPISIERFFKEKGMIEGFENKDDDILNQLF